MQRDATGGKSCAEVCHRKGSILESCVPQVGLRDGCWVYAQDKPPQTQLRFVGMRNLRRSCYTRLLLHNYVVGANKPFRYFV